MLAALLASEKVLAQSGGGMALHPERAGVSGLLNPSAIAQGGDVYDVNFSASTAHSGFFPRVPGNLNERVVEIPVDDVADRDIKLETTIFKPSGGGPFPLIVFNHGKEPGDPRTQTRSRPLTFAREFVRRGYVVVVPNRRGFAHSGGRYTENTCDVTDNGLQQARDVHAAIAFMVKQPYVYATHIVVAGVSHGGLTTMAYGVAPQPGVRGLLNFAGGLRQPTCAVWQTDLTNAFGAYGAETRLPSLWLYGDNDSFWSPQLARRMYEAFASHGAPAEFVAVGRYKDDAHRFIADRDGVALWWPSTAAFLARAGMPTALQYSIDEPTVLPDSGFASIGRIDSVPFIGDDGRAGYQAFLKEYPIRAFAVSESGAWSWASGGDDPMSVALGNCMERSSTPCHLYAINNAVVWTRH